MTASTSERFSGQVALVTGGASGIGLAMVRRLLAEGACVVACDMQTARLAELAPQLAGARQQLELTRLRAPVSGRGG